MNTSSFFYCLYHKRQIFIRQGFGGYAIGLNMLILFLMPFFHHTLFLPWLGRLIGLSAGFAIGNGWWPFIIGGIFFGWVVDRWIIPRIKKKQEEQETHQTYSLAIVRLFAQLAKADGIITPLEVNVFKSSVFYNTDDEDIIGTIFNNARADFTGYAYNAQTIASLCEQNSTLLETILKHLHRLAMCDGGITPTQRQMLYAIANLFHISPDYIDLLTKNYTTTYDAKFEDEKTHNNHSYNNIHKPKSAIGDEDPYHVLGLTKETPMPLIKKHYKKLLHQYHPDKLHNNNANKQEKAHAKKMMTRLNAAYDDIKKQHAKK